MVKNMNLTVPHGNLTRKQIIKLWLKEKEDMAEKRMNNSSGILERNVWAARLAGIRYLIGELENEQ